MDLSKVQIKKLKKIDLIKATREARVQSSRLMNDQGFAVLSVALSHVIADIVEHPEKLVKEYAR